MGESSATILMLGSRERASASSYGHPMKRTPMNYLIAFCRRAPTRDGRWTLGGSAIGAVVGLMVGGVGIAMMGSAFGLPGWFVFGLISALIGKWVGLSRRNRMLSPPNPKA